MRIKTSLVTYCKFFLMLNIILASKFFRNKLRYNFEKFAIKIANTTNMTKFIKIAFFCNFNYKFLKMNVLKQFEKKKPEL